MAVAINRLAGALCFNNKDSVEERMLEFLAVSDIVLKCFYDAQSCFPSLRKSSVFLPKPAKKGLASFQTTFLQALLIRTAKKLK